MRMVKDSTIGSAVTANVTWFICIGVVAVAFISLGSIDASAQTKTNPQTEKGQSVKCPHCNSTKPCEHDDAASAATRSCCAPSSSVIRTEGQELSEISVSTLKERFNSSSDAVRVVSILSPNCPVCQRGKDVVKEIFEKFKNDKLKGLVVWLPMWYGDQPASALAQAGTLDDSRIVQGWDGEKNIGRLFAESLSLKGIAWDVYLVYEPRVKWESDSPPTPTFWMHQLTHQGSGADQQLCLNPDRIATEVANLLAQTN